MARYLLKASDEEFDAWRAAAPRALAPWIRMVLNEAALMEGARVAGGEAVAELREDLRRLAVTAETVQQLERAGSFETAKIAREFVPDFKGGKR